MPMCLVACVGEKQNVVLDTFLMGIKSPHTAIDEVSLNPNYRYLKVEVNGQPALLVLGYQDRSANGINDVWYSSYKEVVQLTGGRLTGTQGLDINWTEVTLYNVPALTDEKLFKEGTGTKPYTPVRFERVRTVMPSYRANISETVELVALPGPPDDAPRAMRDQKDFPHLRWLQESVVMQTNVTSPYLSPLRAIYAIDSKTAQVIYGKQCLTTEFCISWLSWPFSKPEPTPITKNSLEAKSN